MGQSLRMQLAAYLRKRRGGKTLRDFGREAGLSRSTLQRLELGEQNITVDTLENVLRKLKVSINDVFGD
jgi:transcriptional regulator with XRE-family HTH domain